MASSKNDLKDRLTRYHQIKISVTGRKSGQTISIPVWFVLDGGKLYLLPVQGSVTQWYMSDFCAAATECPDSNGYRKSIIGNATLSPPSFLLYILLNSVDSSLNY